MAIEDLNSIHETLLYLVEDDDAQGQKNPHEDETVDQPAPTDEFAGAEETVFEGLQNWRYWIQTHDFMDGEPKELHAFGLAERIYYRSSVHPELDQETEQHLEVAVFRGHR